jgi:nitrous oxide reductase accessory protein NosL
VRAHLTILLTAALISGCQSAGDALSDSSSPIVITPPAAGAIAGDMASRLAEQIGPAGSISLAMTEDKSDFAEALEAALKVWGYHIIPDGRAANDQKALHLAWSIDSTDGQAFALLTTPSVALSRTYVLTSQGAAPASPLSVMQR